MHQGAGREFQSDRTEPLGAVEYKIEQRWIMGQFFRGRGQPLSNGQPSDDVQFVIVNIGRTRRSNVQSSSNSVPG